MAKENETPRTNPAEIENLIEQIQGEFLFSGVLLPIGRSRLIASSKAFKDLNVLIELKQTPDTDPEKRNRILLHMRLKSLGSPTYATLLSVKVYKDRERR